jgi:hypothetical protein
MCCCFAGTLNYDMVLGLKAFARTRDDFVTFRTKLRLANYLIFRSDNGISNYEWACTSFYTRHIRKG